MIPEGRARASLALSLGPGLLVVFLDFCFSH